MPVAKHRAQLGEHPPHRRIPADQILINAEVCELVVQPFCRRAVAMAVGEKGAIARPERPPASGVPSPAAMLQADRTTQSALSFKVATFDAVSSPSFSGAASVVALAPKPIRQDP